MKLLWTSLCLTFGEHEHLFLLDKYPGVKLLSDGVYGCLVLVDTAKHFSKTVVPVYSPTSNIWEFQVFSILTSTWPCVFLIFAILMGM